MNCQNHKCEIVLILSIFILFLASGRGVADPQEAQRSGDFQYTEYNAGAVITGYEGSGTNVRIPDTLNDLPVVAIGDSAFAGSPLVSITVPEGVISIGERAFANSDSLESISLPSSIEAIALSAFLGTPLDSKKLFPDDSPKNELELYCHWVRYLEDLRFEDRFSDGEPKNMIEKEDVVYGTKVKVQILPQEENAFDENAEIDGLIFATYSVDSHQELKIYSYRNRPCWYWDTQDTDYLISTLPRQNNGRWTPAHGKQFFNDLRSIGFFKWDRSYRTPDIACGMSWDVFVKFSNSDRYFFSVGSNYFPPNFDEFIDILHKYGLRKNLERFQDVPDNGDEQDGQSENSASVSADPKPGESSR